jgi:hypothetical protein
MGGQIVGGGVVQKTRTVYQGTGSNPPPTTGSPRASTATCKHLPKINIVQHIMVVKELVGVNPICH